MQPVKYSRLDSFQKRRVRNAYVEFQGGKCMYCGGSIKKDPPARILSKSIDWSLFPENFLKYPVHLQHNHATDMTEGAVHAYCNAVLWQYEGR